MPRINLTGTEGVKDFPVVPPGDYIATVTHVEQRKTKTGDEMWPARLRILDGPYAGQLLFDHLVFSPRAMKRVKHILEALRIDISGEIDITPEMIKGRACRVRVEGKESYVASDGAEKTRSKIAFAGYQALGEDEAAKWETTESDEESPL